MSKPTLCRHCERAIIFDDGLWVDPEATGDDSIWREVCDSHDTFQANHQPEIIGGSSYKLWNKRLDGNVISRGQIAQWCHAVAAGSMGYVIGGAKTNLTPEECEVLADKFRARCQVLSEGGFSLTPEHELFGIEWLRTYPRRAESVGLSPEHLETFRGFRFISWETVSETWVRAEVIPVYRVLSKLDPVDYSWSPWQRGAYS